MSGILEFIPGTEDVVLDDQSGKAICNLVNTSSFLSRPELVGGLAVFVFIAWVGLLSLQDNDIIGIYLRPLHGSSENSKTVPKQTVRGAMISSFLDFFFPFLSFSIISVLILTALSRTGYCETVLGGLVTQITEHSQLKQLVEHYGSYPLKIARYIPLLRPSGPMPAALALLITGFVLWSLLKFIFRYRFTVLGSTAIIFAVIAFCMLSIHIHEHRP